MRIICKKCGTEAHSKCPSMRSIFPSRESEEESNFWHGMGFELKPVEAGEHWKPGVKRLTVTMIVFPDEDEATAMKRFVEKMKRIPDAEMDRYLCKHSYVHTEDCRICSFKMEASDV